jgi:hypothetical protein
MLLHGSCQCGAVKFRVVSHHPVPYQRCYCSICRKAGGGGGFSINIEAEAASLVVTGEQHVKVHRALLEQDGKRAPSEHRRHFCGECGCQLWAFHPSWPHLVYPVAGAIDSQLPEPPEHVHMMLGSKASWVRLEGGEKGARFEAYPQQSLAEWHETRNLTSD